MTLYGDILLESDFWATANDTERCAALQLWWAAWKQIPAGSLPNNDAVLCRLAGFDRNLKKWAKVKKLALHGFVLCNDGRLYHPFICEKAINAFEKRRKEREWKSHLRGKYKKAQHIENIENEVDLSTGQAWDIPGTSRAIGKGIGIGNIITIEATHSTEPVPQPTRVASLNVVQGSDAPTIEAAPEDPPAPVNDRHLMPRAKDPPYLWIGSGLSRGPDGRPRTALEKMEPHLIAGKQGANRVMVDVTARLICTAALIDHSWRGDWHVLVNWLDEGLDAHHEILPAIREVVERQSKGAKGYRQPTTLRYFDAAIREYAARRRAA